VLGDCSPSACGSKNDAKPPNVAVSDQGGNGQKSGKPGGGAATEAKVGFRLEPNRSEAL